MIRILKKPKSIKVQVYISPILYENSEILSSVKLKKKNAWYNAVEPIWEKIERISQQSQNCS